MPQTLIERLQKTFAVLRKIGAEAQYSETDERRGWPTNFWIWGDGAWLFREFLDSVPATIQELEKAREEEIAGEQGPGSIRHQVWLTSEGRWSGFRPGRGPVEEKPATDTIESVLEVYLGEDGTRKLKAIRSIVDVLEKDLRDQAVDTDSRTAYWRARALAAEARLAELEREEEG